MTDFTIDDTARQDLAANPQLSGGPAAQLAPACKTCGGKGYTEYEGGEGEGYPSRPEIEACSCREEAPAPMLRVAVEALERIATVDMGGGFLGAQACRQVAAQALAALQARDPA